MSSLNKFKNESKLRQYFKDNLELEDEDFERRLQLYLEIFPFLAIDFRLKEDCHVIHQTANIVSKTSSGHNHKIELKNTKETENSYFGKSESYRKILSKLREAMEVNEIEITSDIEVD